MSREILFKAKRLDNGEWVEGGYFSEPYTDKTFIIRWNSTGMGFNEFIEVNPETVCQYTGLTDKNGKKIWENDIVQRTDLHDAKKPSIGFIEYDVENTAFLIRWVDVVNYSATYPWKEKIEVVGNIFDNPELL